MALSLLKDEKRRAELGQQGYKQAAQFDLDHIAEVELSLLSGISDNGLASHDSDGFLRTSLSARDAENG
jgi:hypothetical protein